MSAMVAKYEAAARHRPIAHGRDTKAGGSPDPRPQARPRQVSETRLQAAVVAERKRDERDPYADVPCTD